MKPNTPREAQEARVYLTLDRAAHHTGLNPTTLKQLIATGELRAYRLGRRIPRVDGHDLERITLEAPCSLDDDA